MNIPSIITQSTTSIWRDDSAVVPIDRTATSADWALKYYLRTNSPAVGHTVTGSAYNTGWEFTISSTDSGNFEAGDWTWQAVISKGSESFELGRGLFTVKKSYIYTGTPTGLDGRSQAKKDLDSVKAAIRHIIDNKASEYTIGDRTFKYADLSELRKRESQLKAECVREDKADMIAQGLGNPHKLFVRF